MGSVRRRPLGTQVRLLKITATYLLAEQTQVSCFPIYKLGIMRVCCENQMRSRINTLALYVTHSKCSRNVSYNRNVRLKANISSEGQFRRAPPFEYRPNYNIQ